MLTFLCYNIPRSFYLVSNLTDSYHLLTQNEFLDDHKTIDEDQRYPHHCSH